MITNRKIHKISGLSAGIVILILSISGLFLNHDNWKFLHNITFETVPSHLYKLNNRSFNSYWINPSNKNHIITAGVRGVFESLDNSNTFLKTLDEIIYSIKDDGKNIYVATSNGIFKKGFEELTYSKFLLEDKFISSLNIYKDKLVAVEDKTNIYLIDLNTNQIESINQVDIPAELLKQDITLSRFIRDLHYGRGLFDGDISLLINDYATVVLIILGTSGFILWFLIRKIKTDKTYKKRIKFFVKIHSNIFSLLAIVPIIILLITGIFLDHGKDLRAFMQNNIIPNEYLPPVYKTLKSDIWGADYNGGSFYIGNRYGVFKTNDFKKYEFVSKGFAYSMNRKDEVLYVGGMGSANRVLENDNWIILKNTPHMFKDVFIEDKKINYFSSHNHDLEIPKFQNITLYSLMFSLHDGSFFASWWIWINDIASILLLVLLISGIFRWYFRSTLRRRINKWI